jgi:hypothetical protein
MCRNPYQGQEQARCLWSCDEKVKQPSPNVTGLKLNVTLLYRYAQDFEFVDANIYVNSCKSRANRKIGNQEILKGLPYFTSQAEFPFKFKHSYLY